MSEQLRCPICGEPTNVYMGKARKDGFRLLIPKEFIVDEINDKYISNLMTRNKKIDEMSNK